MNILSFLLAVAAFAVFLVISLRPALTRLTVAAGLALFTAAFILQLTWVTVHTVHFG